MLYGWNSIPGEPAKKEYTEKPKHVHDHWHTDIAYIKIAGVFYFLIMVLDGHSRFLLGWDLMTDMMGKSVEDFIQRVKEKYPFAVINIINTSIGGENSLSGEKRFDSTVLNHHPDVLFIDYALNDRSAGLEKAAKAWSSMIEKALEKNIKVILLTPSPDQRVDILLPNNELEKHALQIKDLAKKYDIGLIDSYEEFRKKVISGEPITNYMSQVNHPNQKGHFLIANKIAAFF
jgi:hypothetical protein